MSREHPHVVKGTGKAQDWKGWRVDQPPADVVIKHVEPTAKAEPMTEAQAEALRKLCASRGVDFNPKWTKRQAQRRFRQLKRRPGRRGGR